MEQVQVLTLQRLPRPSRCMGLDKKNCDYVAAYTNENIFT